MNLIKISIITPAFNRADFIANAVESVLFQNYKDIEHIIVDGGSTDGTLELLKRYPHLKIQSGRDNGMYDALNKGLELVKGEIVGFLNTDDLYAENIFSIVAEKFQRQDILAIAGEASIFTVSPDGRSNTISNYSPQSSSLLKASTIGSPYMNAWFFRRSIFEKIHKFNVHYRIAADREFMLRFALSGLPYEIINTLFYQYRKHSGSMTMGLTDQKLQRIIDEHVFMTGAYLEKKNLPIDARSLIRKLRTRETSEMAVRSLRKLKFDKFTYYSRRGCEYDPLWFPKFAWHVIRNNYE
jgi:glycosyltransferase involved in cell wall biosynthesis